MSLQAQSILEFARSNISAAVHEEVRLGMCRGLYLVVIRSECFGVKPLVIRPGNGWFCREPEVMLAALENAEDIPLGDWPQHVEQLFEELAPPEMVAEIEHLGYDFMVHRLLGLCKDEPGKTKLRRLAAEVSTRNDYQTYISCGYGIWWWPLDSLPVRGKTDDVSESPLTVNPRNVGDELL